MKKIGKKLVSYLLVLMMLVGVLPMSAFADQTDAAQFVAQQLSLGDDLTMRFYVAVDAAYVDSASMTVTVGDAIAGTYPVKGMTPESDGTYLFTADLAAAQMTDNITLELKSGDEILGQKTYSVRDYAQYLLQGSYSAATKNMVKQMLNYGAMAQLYFDHNAANAEDLANYGYELGSAPIVPEDVYDVTAEGTVDGISYYGATLLFESKIAVRYYFNAPNGVTGYTFTVDGTPYEAKAKDTQYYVEIPDINPQDYDKAVNITVSDGTDSFTVNYSPMHYIVRMYGKDSTSDALKNLVQAMYGYHEAAAAFTGVERIDFEVISESIANQKDTNVFVDYGDDTLGGNWFNRYNVKIDDAVDADGNILKDAKAVMRVKSVGQGGVYSTLLQLELTAGGSAIVTGCNENGPTDYNFKTTTLTADHLKQLATPKGLSLYAVHHRDAHSIGVYAQNGNKLDLCYVIGARSSEYDFLCKGYEAQCNVDGYTIDVDSVSHTASFQTAVQELYGESLSFDGKVMNTSSVSVANNNTVVQNSGLLIGNWYTRYNIKIDEAVDENGNVLRDAVALMRVKAYGGSDYNAMLRLTLSSESNIGYLEGTNVNGSTDYNFTNVRLTSNQLKQLTSEDGLNVFAVHTIREKKIDMYLQDGNELISMWSIGGASNFFWYKGYEAQCNVSGFEINVENVWHDAPVLDVMQTRYGQSFTVQSSAVVSEATQTTMGTNTFVDYGSATVGGNWFNRYNIKIDGAVDADGNILKTANAIMRVKCQGSSGVYNAMLKVALTEGGTGVITGTNANGPSDYNFMNYTMTAEQLKQLASEDGLNIYAIHDSGAGVIPVYVQEGDQLVCCWLIGGSTTELLAKGYEAQCDVDGFSINVQSVKHSGSFLSAVEERYGDTLKFAVRNESVVNVKDANTVVNNSGLQKGAWFIRYNVKMADAVDADGNVLMDAVALMRVKAYGGSDYSSMLKLTLFKDQNKGVITGTNANGSSDYNFIYFDLTADQLKQLTSEDGLNLWAVHNQGATKTTVYVQGGTTLTTCFTIGGATQEFWYKGYEAQCNVDNFTIEVEAVAHAGSFLDVVVAQYGEKLTIS